MFSTRFLVCHDLPCLLYMRVWALACASGPVREMASSSSLTSALVSRGQSCSQRGFWSAMISPFFSICEYGPWLMPQVQYERWVQIVGLYDPTGTIMSVLRINKYLIMSYNTHFSKQKNTFINNSSSYTQIYYSYMFFFFFLNICVHVTDYEMSQNNYVFQLTLLYYSTSYFQPTNTNHPQLLFRH